MGWFFDFSESVSRHGLKVKSDRMSETVSRVRLSKTKCLKLGERVMRTVMLLFAFVVIFATEASAKKEKRVVLPRRTNVSKLDDAFFGHLEHAGVPEGVRIARLSIARSWQKKMSYEASKKNAPAVDKLWTTPYLPVIHYSLKQGEFGVFRHGSRIVRPVRVVDGQNMIVRLGRDSPSYVSRSGTRVIGLQSDIVWLSGIPTKGASDGESFHDADRYLLKVNGTKKYGGSTIKLVSKVAKLSELDSDSFMFGKAYNEFKRRRPATARASYDVRTWRTARGSYRLDAKFAGKSGEIIKLKKSDGTTVKVHLDILHEDDREYLADVFRRR